MADWITPAQVVEKTGRNKTVVYEALESGELHGHQRKPGGRWSIHPAVPGAWIRGLDQHEACGCPRVTAIRRQPTARRARAS